MRSVSASVIVLGGLGVLVAGAYHHHSDTSLFLSVVGVAVAVVGLWGWFSARREPLDY